ncbi:MAG: hypothetical protein HQK83_12035 [Fibrobacteria bacterium]|nr:hypothetical protein [Fibrobacteria bacterium]
MLKLLIVLFTFFSCTPGPKRPTQTNQLFTGDNSGQISVNTDSGQPTIRENANGVEETSWSIPPKASPFNNYSNKYGFTLQATSKNWREAPAKKTHRGIPVKTLVSVPDKQLQLEVFDIDQPNKLTDISLQDSIIAYLFKVKVNFKTTQIGPYEVQSWSSTLDTASHRVIKLKSDSNLIVLFFNSKSKHTRALPEIGTINIKSNFLSLGTDLRIEFGQPKEYTSYGHESEFFKGVFLNTIGLFYLQDSSYNKALDYFTQAWQTDKSFIPFISNCATMYHVMGETASGIQFLKQHMPQVSASSHLAGLFGALHEEVGSYQTAKEWAERALTLEPNNEEWLINLSDALWQLGEKVQSKAVLLHLYQKKPSFRLSVYLASTHLGLEEFHNARQVLEKAHKKHLPTIKSIKYMLISLNGLKDYTSALSYFRRHAGDSANAAILAQKATSEFNLKYYLPAEYSVNTALNVDPFNEEARNLSAKISTVLGNKSNLIINKPISPLALPLDYQETREILKKCKTLLSPLPALTLLQKKNVFSWHKSRHWKKTTRLIYYIPDMDSLDGISELSFEFNPNYSKTYINHFHVLSHTFKRLETKNLDHYYVTGSHNTRLHPENVLVHLPISISDSAFKGPFYLDILFTEESRFSSASFPYIQYTAKSPFPFYQNTYDILSPPPDLNIFQFGQITLDSSAKHLRFITEPTLFPLSEKFSPVYEEYGAGFSIAPQKTWAEAGEDYMAYLHRTGVNEDSIPFSIQESALERLNKRTEGEKPLKALFTFVRDSIGYNNYEFNLHALIPEKSDEVLIKKYSDCKGHALLLTHLLRARGLKAHLCLVSQEHTGFPSQPTIHQFNHMIVYVEPDTGSGWFLDPTEKFHPFRQVPLMLQGRHALILEQGNCHLTTIPEIKIAHEHGVRISHQVIVVKSLMANGTDSIMIFGKLAADFRAKLSGWGQHGKYETLISWITESYPGYTNGRLSLFNENNIDLPLILRFTYQRELSQELKNKKLYIAPKLETSFFRFPHNSNRKTPIYFPFEISVNSTWHISLPEEYTFTTRRQPEQQVTDIYSWERSYRFPEKNVCVKSQIWTLSPFLAQPEEYTGIQKEWEILLKRSSGEISIEK